MVEIHLFFKYQIQSGLGFSTGGGSVEKYSSKSQHLIGERKSRNDCPKGFVKSIATRSSNLEGSNPTWQMIPSKIEGGVLLCIGNIRHLAKNYDGIILV